MPEAHPSVGSDSEEEWQEIKSWYDDNPESEEKPVMQFPVVYFLMKNLLQFKMQRI